MSLHITSTGILKFKNITARKTTAGAVVLELIQIHRGLTPGQQWRAEWVG